MSADIVSESIFIEDFGAEKQLSFFQALKLNRFSGKLSFFDLKKTEWVFFLFMGRIIYATGGKHLVRRWRRNLAEFFPQIAKVLPQEIQQIKIENVADVRLSWDYHLLNLWFDQQKISLEQIAASIKARTNEVLFDLTQASVVSFELVEQKEFAFKPLCMVDAQQQIDAAGKLWSKWQEYDFQGISPDLAPHIVRHDRLQANTNEKTYQVFQRLFDGKHSIRDIAVQKQSDVLTFMRSLSSFLDFGAIAFAEIPDLPYPIALPETTADTAPSESKGSHSPKVACVTLNGVMKQQLSKVSQKLNYGFVEVKDCLQALALLLEAEPDLIAIDVELPESQAYEICTQLRKLDYLNDVPIVLFARNIGLIERMKSKMSGASELFQHSMDIKAILTMVEKHMLMRQIARSKAG